jgi:hypothetical protein
MIELLKKFIHLFIKSHRLNVIDKQCDKYFKIKRNLECQQFVVNMLIDEFEKDFGEKIRTKGE